MAIYELLRQDHETVKDMLGKLKDTSEGAGRTREELFNQVKQELEIHTEFENEVFYPAVAENQNAAQTVEEAIDEHEQVDSLLDELTEADKTSPEFLEQIGKLEQMLLHHIDEEENRIFPVAQSTISEDRANEMGGQYKDRKQQELRTAS